MIFATDPSGAMLPYRHWRWPVFLIGFSIGRMISWPSLRSAVFDQLAEELPPLSEQYNKHGQRVTLDMK